MVYKKYIYRKGKKLGPYYYDSVKDKNGKVHSIYIGKDPAVYLQKKEQSKKSRLRRYKKTFSVQFTQKSILPISVIIVLILAVGFTSAANVDLQAGITTAVDQSLGTTLAGMSSLQEIMEIPALETSAGGPTGFAPAKEPFSGPFCGGDYSGSGDWNVNSPVLCTDEIINLTGNLTIQAGGELTFDNITLRVNVTTDNLFGITVQEHGTFNVTNGSLLTNGDTAGAEWRLTVNNGNSTFEMYDGRTAKTSWQVGTYGILIYADGTVKMKNVSISSSYNGIQLDGATDNDFENLTISVPHRAIDTKLSASDNRISHSYIKSTEGEGLFIDSTVHNFTIFNTTFIATNAVKEAVFLYKGDNHNITNCTLKGKYFGLRTEGSAGNIIKDSYLEAQHNDSSTSALYLYSGSNNNLIENTILNNSAGNTIDSSSSWNNTIANSTLVSPSIGNDTYAHGTGNISLLNSSFDNSKFRLGNTAEIFVEWYLWVYVNNSTGSDISGADVNVYNTTADLQWNDTTSASGLTPTYATREYTNNTGGTIYNTNLSINVSKVGYNDNDSVFNLTGNVQYNATLSEANPDVVPTEIIYTPLGPQTGQSVTINATIKNVENANAGAFNVTLYINGNYQNNTTVNSLNANSQTTVSFNWTAESELHQIKVYADSQNDVNESYENNNNLTRMIGVDWPMFHQTVEHYGVANTAGPTTNNTLWTFNTGADVNGPPIVANGIVYVGSEDFKLYAINATTNESIWNFSTGAQIYSAPAIANGIVYVGSGDNTLYAINATTNESIWNYSIGSAVFSHPTVADNIVYVGSGSGASGWKLYAINATNNNSIWNYSTGDAIQTSPAVSNGIVYVGSDDDKLYAINATTNESIWNYTAGGDVLSSPAIANGIVYFGSYTDKKVYAVNATTNESIWNYTTGNVLVSSPAVVNGIVYIGSTDNKLSAINATTNESIWNFSTGGSISQSSPAIAGDIVYVGTVGGDDTVYAVNATTGASIWNYTTGGEIYSSPAIANGTVYIGSDDSKLYAFGASPTTSYCNGNYTDGNWDITGNLTCANETIPLNGDLTISNGGNLTFQNITLKVNGSSDGEYGIDVQSGGRFDINGTYAPSNITNGDTAAAEFWFNVSAGASFEMDSSSLSECGWTSGAFFTRGLTIRASYANITNSNLTGNYYGFQVLTTNYTNISNNIISNSEARGIGINASHNITIFNNTIYNTSSSLLYITNNVDLSITKNYLYNSTSRGVAIHGSNRTIINENTITRVANISLRVQEVINGTIHNNTIYNSTLAPIYLQSCENLTLTDNYLYNTSGGHVINIQFGNRLTIRNNILANATNATRSGIRFFYTNNSTIVDNNISNTPAGILLNISENNTVQNNIIHNNTIGIKLLTSNHTEMETNTISNNTYGVHSMNSSNNTLSNSTIENCTYDAYLYDTGNLTYLNVTFNKSKTGFETGSTAELFVEWYLWVYVNNSIGSDISGADVNVYNTTADLQWSDTTDGSGLTPTHATREYTNNTGGTQYDTNLSINVSATGYADNDSVFNLTFNYQYNATLSEVNLDIVPTEINYTPIGPQTGQNVAINATIKNTGGTNAGAFNVTLYINGNYQNNTTVNSLNANSQTTVSFNWTAESELHQIKVYADSQQDVSEDYETNNNLTRMIGVDWPMFHQTVEHYGFANTSGPRGPNLLWSTDLGHNANGISVSNGIAYVGSDDDNVYALNATTGAQIWNYSTSGDVTTSAAIYKGVVYIGSVDNKLYALNATDGTEIWNYSTDGSVKSSPAIVDGIVYFGAYNNRLHALNASNGAHLWNTSLGGLVLSSPAVSNGIIYAGSYNNRLYALNATDGTQIWNYNTGSDVASSPAVADGIVYFGSRDNNTYALNATNGTQIWNYTTNGSVDCSPAVANGVVYICSYDNKTYALNATDGTGIWNYSTSNKMSVLIVADDIVYGGSVNNYVYALNVSNGAHLWNYSVSNLATGLAIANNILYAGSYDDTVYAFEARSYCNGNYFGGDWNVNNTLVCTDEEIILSGDLTIQDAGNLTFGNITLNVSSPSLGGYKINVTAGGIFDVQNNSNLSGVSSSETFIFEAYNNSKLTVNNSYMSYYGAGCSNCWNLRGRYCGLSIATNNVTIRNSTFENNGIGIHLVAGYRDASQTIEIINNTVKKSLCYGIVVDPGMGNGFDYISNVSIVNNTIFDVRKNVTSGYGFTSAGSQAVGTGVWTFAVNPQNGTSTRNWMGDFSAEIRGNSINYTHSIGIYLDAVSDFTVESNNISNVCAVCTGVAHFLGGILLEEDSTKFNTIANNTISDSSAQGISFRDQNPRSIEDLGISNNTIINNTIRHCSNDGIHLEQHTVSNDFINNTIENVSKRGIWVSARGDYVGVWNYSPENNTFTGNYINSTLHGIYLWNASRNTFTANNITSTTGNGVYLVNSDYNTFSTNEISHNNLSGIYLEDSTYATLTENNISDNSRYGIYLDPSTGSTIRYNNLYNNSLYNLYNNQSYGVTAENNYWGFVTCPEIAATIYDYSNDNSLGIADYDPFWNDLYPSGSSQACPIIEGGAGGGGGGPPPERNYALALNLTPELVLEGEDLSAIARNTGQLSIYGLVLTLRDLPPGVAGSIDPGRADLPVGYKEEFAITFTGTENLAPGKYGFRILALLNSTLLATAEGTLEIPEPEKPLFNVTIPYLNIILPSVEITREGSWLIILLAALLTTSVVSSQYYYTGSILPKRFQAMPMRKYEPMPPIKTPPSPEELLSKWMALGHLKLINYVGSALEDGYERSEIRGALLKNGWQMETVNKTVERLFRAKQEVKKAHLPKPPKPAPKIESSKVQIGQYITECKKQGHETKTIENALIKKGWQKEQVKEALSKIKGE